MAAAKVPASLVPVLPVFTDAERLALAGYLAGYRGLTRKATITRRLSTIAGFYKYTVEDGTSQPLPAAPARRPRVDYESHATALDRNELGALLVAAGLGPTAEHALISMLARNGLRVSQATGAGIDHLGLERGHRTLVVTRKRGKVVTVPLAPRTARANGCVRRPSRKPRAGRGTRRDAFPGVVDCSQRTWILGITSLT
ncbi:MAG TPA: hypothetical protein VG142_17875 [Trebonia sp.]|jgi:integrase|nr:hypothetical protein [Trebonia sp.]